MTELQFTDHAVTRMAQRSIKENDIDLIMLIGTEVRDGYMVLAKDCEAAQHVLKRLMDRVNRLNGKRLVVQNGKIITAYHAKVEMRRRLVRGAEEREMAA